MTETERIRMIQFIAKSIVIIAGWNQYRFHQIIEDAAKHLDVLCDMPFIQSDQLEKIKGFVLSLQDVIEKNS